MLQLCHRGPQMSGHYRGFEDVTQEVKGRVLYGRSMVLKLSNEERFNLLKIQLDNYQYDPSWPVITNIVNLSDNIQGLDVVSKLDVDGMCNLMNCLLHKYVDGIRIHSNGTIRAAM